MKKNLIQLVLAGCLLMTTSVYAGTSVIASASFPADSVTAKQLKRIWLGKKVKIGGISPKRVDLSKGSGDRKIFYKKIVKKSSSKLKAYWAKVMFKGNSFPPKTMDDNSSVKEWVNESSKRIGYISSDAVDSSVKVLMTLD
ncbi:MAG: phosphate ABC transporter substrate-binding protein [Methylococcales bacterium]|jgi:ABC-type phosphate transport system substrate-binding protein|nr:phosphate ABC transporter substrate-binding protein [Methylococcales bacterium]